MPAEFFVHRHIYGKWTCRCCQRLGLERLVQEPADLQIIDGGIAASGLVAHTLISRFVDHLPYYRQEDINARSGVHTPRSTLARTAGNAGAAMVPLYEAHKRFVLKCPVLHADETPVAKVDPGTGKTKRTYIWAYARGELDAQAGVIYEFCLGRGSKYPVAFLGAAQGPPGSALEEQTAWRGTLVCDQYAGYDAVLDKRVYSQRSAAHCAVPPIAWRTPDASSTNWSAPARWPRRRSNASAGLTTSKVSSKEWTRSSVWRPDSSSRGHCGRSCTSG